MILGLDIATTTGFCWFDPPRTDDSADVRAALAAMRPGSFKVVGAEPEDKAADMAPHLIKLLKPTKPDFIIIEAPARHVQQHDKVITDMHGTRTIKTINPGTTILLNQLTGAAVTIARAFNIPFMTVSEETWRKEAYGFGRKKGWQRAHWKKHARQLCAAKGISVTNDDQAEACWIAFVGWRSQTYRLMQAQRAA
jgi:hypothetical protein